MTIAMPEQVDAEPCDVLRGGDGPVYFLLGGQLYVVHEVLGRWIEADQSPAACPTAEPPAPGYQETERGRNGGAGAGPVESRAARPPSPRLPSDQPPSPAASGEPRMSDPPMVEHWLVTASVGRFGRPAVFRLQRRPAPPAKGPDSWTVRAERR